MYIYIYTYTYICIDIHTYQYTHNTKTRKMKWFIISCSSFEISNTVKKYFSICLFMILI